MSQQNDENYKACFAEAFEIDIIKIKDDLEYNSIPEWDSIGHMTLISALEDKFNISFETDDIIDFSSFQKGKEILKKYSIEF